MPEKRKSSPYRWAVLGAFMLISIAVQVQWVSLAPVARAAERFYGGQIAPGSPFGVDFLAMSFLIVYLVASLPASYLIDTYGIRVGVGLGAILCLLGGLLKGLSGGSFAAVLAGQLVLAVAQPFVINAATAVCARWFPLGERGLAVGLASLAQYLGIALAMIAGPLLVVGDPAAPNYGEGIGTLHLVYGIGTAVAALACVAILRERPREAVEEAVERQSPFAGAKTLFASRDYLLLLLLFTIGLGIFNALSSLVDAVAGHLGVSDSDGLIGTFMIGAGILGAVVIPMLSDAVGRRKPFLVLCMAGMVPGVAGLAFARLIAPDPAGAYLVAKISAGLLGFFVMAAGPIGFEYAAEIGRPAPESTSQGFLLLSGQVSGIIFMAVMGVRGLMGPALAAFSILSVLCLAVTFALRESRLLTEAKAGSGKGS
jgi:MFS family permease